MAGTDWVDGYVARRFDQVSKLGRVMDPIADRLSLIAVAVTLVIAGVVEWRYLAALLVPDAVLLALTLFYFHGHPDLPVSRVGKDPHRPAAARHAAAGAVPAAGPRRGRYLHAAWIVLGLGLVGHWIAAYNYFWAILGRAEQPVGRTTAAPADGVVAVLLAVLGAFCLAFGAQRQGSAVKADTGGLA